MDESGRQNPNRTVFISYASDPDEPAALLLVAELEKAAVTCWVACRDVRPGENYAAAIIAAIKNSKITVLLMSSASNRSPHVANEIERAVNYRKVIIPVRLEEVLPAPELELHLSTPQRIDFFRPEKKAENIRRLLDRLRELEPSLPALTVAPVTHAPVAPRRESVPQPSPLTPCVVAQIAGPPQSLLEPKPEVSSNAQLDAPPTASEKLDYSQEGEVTLELIGTSSKSRIPKKAGGFLARNLALVGQYACVVVSGEGARIYDLRRESQPTLVSAVHFPYDPIWFQPVENLGILRAHSGSVVVVDLTDISDPKPIPFENHYNCRFNNCGKAVMNLGSLVVDLSGRSDVDNRFLDFADPSSVRDLGKVHFWASTATFYGNYLLLGGASEPKVKPVLVGRDGLRELKSVLLDSDAGLVVPKSIAAVASRLYVIGERQHRPLLLTYDLSEFPHNLSVMNEQEFARIGGLGGVQMTHHGGWLCVSDAGQIFLIDISMPDKIRMAAKLSGAFQAANVRDDRLYASDDRDVFVYAITQVAH